ncbi:PIN domain-containing protein [Candidatus Gracilibacteria bacterium]|nr:PIN domain-containing protein [Candidatus Gracilibacteria bacterium]
MNEKEVKHIFIDSNIFLDFYRLGKEDLEKLNQLIDFVKNGDIKIYLTKQVYDEFYRHREDTFQKTYKGFLDSKTDIQMNSIFKNYPEYKKITLLKKALEKLKSDLGQKVENDMSSKSLIADEVVRKIFEASFYVDSDKFLEMAIIRHRLGNPPGKKNNSYGDEINWETLLSVVPDGEKLIIVSNDGDYESPMSERKINSYLEDEWGKKKKSKIYLYKTLSSFFREHDISIEFEIEKEKNLLVENLINSGSFMVTHEIIRRISKYNSFSDEQIQGLATALLGNSQVRSIIEDEDVKSFYKTNLLSRSDIFDDEMWSEVESLIIVNPVQVNKDIEDIIKSLDDKIDEDINVDDIPF